MLHGKHISLIVAMDRNRVIGRDGDMPWHLPADLAHFKRTTMGLPVIMGRKTWASIGRPLPGRQNIVLTRDASFSAEGCVVAGSVEGALEVAEGDAVMIIGGGQIYAAAIEFADRLIVTRVDAVIENGDTHFPEIDPERWIEADREQRPADDRNRYKLDFIEYLRR